MRNRILSITRNVIPYVKELQPVAGSVIGCLVMQQLDYWFHLKPDGFYKFMNPAEHPFYRQGDSWVEELGISDDEFRYAFDRIGTRYKSKSDFDKAAKAGDIFKGCFYCSYVARRENLTYYFRNHELLDSALDALITGENLQLDCGVQTANETLNKEGEASKKRSNRLIYKQLEKSIYRTGKADLQNRKSRFAEMEKLICRNRVFGGPSIQRIPTDTTTTTGRSCGGNLEHESKSQETLFWPHCSPEEKEAIAGLVAALPEDQQQVFLDEIEGARQAGVIRTNPVAYAGGLVRAILSGTFAVGHGASVASKRRASSLDRATSKSPVQFPQITPEDLARGKKLMDKVIHGKNKWVK